jgi:hypothetical protein
MPFERSTFGQGDGRVQASERLHGRLQGRLNCDFLTRELSAFRPRYRGNAD